MVEIFFLLKKSKMFWSKRDAVVFYRKLVGALESTLCLDHSSQPRKGLVMAFGLEHQN